MKINIDFEVGETVCFANDPEKKPYIVIGGKFSIVGVFYSICHNKETLEVSEDELTAVPRVISEDMEIEDLDVSWRVYSRLKANKINKVSEMIHIKKDTYLGMDGFGKKSLQEVIAALNKYGVELT